MCYMPDTVENLTLTNLFNYNTNSLRSRRYYHCHLTEVQELPRVTQSVHGEGRLMQLIQNHAL